MASVDFVCARRMCVCVCVFVELTEVSDVLSYINELNIKDKLKVCGKSLSLP